MTLARLIGKCLEARRAALESERHALLEDAKLDLAPLVERASAAYREDDEARRGAAAAHMGETAAHAELIRRSGAISLARGLLHDAEQRKMRASARIREIDALLNADAEAQQVRDEHRAALAMDAELAERQRAIVAAIPRLRATAEMADCERKRLEDAESERLGLTDDDLDGADEIERATARHAAAVGRLARAEEMGRRLAAERAALRDGFAGARARYALHRMRAGELRWSAVTELLAPEAALLAGARAATRAEYRAVEIPAANDLEARRIAAAIKDELAPWPAIEDELAPPSPSEQEGEQDGEQERARAAASG